MIKLTPDIERLRKELNFPLEQIEIAIRANFRCEYCDKYLLESVDVYDSWQIDHIVPNGNNDPSNLALTCKTCNFAKRHSRKKELEKCKSRSEKIGLAKKIVSERRANKDATLQKVRDFASELMRNKDKILLP